MKRFILAAVLVCLSTPALAQLQCGTHKVMTEGLAGGEYKEHSVVSGFSTSGHIFQIFANEETGTFTAVMTDRNGKSCVAVSGNGLVIKSEEQRRWDTVESVESDEQKMWDAVE